MRSLIATTALALLLSGCATPRGDPGPLAGDLSKKDIETAIADAMMVTAAELFRLALDEDLQRPEGVLRSESLELSWSETDMASTVGVIELSMESHALDSGFFRDEYRDYIFTGTVAMTLLGDTAELVMDLYLTHSRPDTYPVTRLELDLSNLGDEIDPNQVRGFIRANGYEVDVPTVVGALEVGD